MIWVGHRPGAPFCDFTTEQSRCFVPENPGVHIARVTEPMTDPCLYAIYFVTFNINKNPSHVSINQTWIRHGQINLYTPTVEKPNLIESKGPYKQPYMMGLCLQMVGFTLGHSCVFNGTMFELPPVIVCSINNNNCRYTMI